MKYIIIGLGNYGHVLAEELSTLGHEVIGADLDEGRVDSIKDKFNVPEKFVGYFVNELNLDEEFNLKLIGLKRSNTIKNCLGISLVEHKVVNELPEDAKIRPDDVLVCYGKYSDFQKLWKAL